MSFSFLLTAATKEAVAEIVAAKLAEVVAAQPIHEIDCGHVAHAVNSYMTLVPEVEDHDFNVAVGGWLTTDETQTVRGASVNVSITMSPRVALPAEIDRQPV